MNVRKIFECSAAENHLLKTVSVRDCNNWFFIDRISQFEKKREILGKKWGKIYS